MMISWRGMGTNLVIFSQSNTARLIVVQPPTPPTATAIPDVAARKVINMLARTNALMPTASP